MVYFICVDGNHTFEEDDVMDQSQLLSQLLNNDQLLGKLSSMVDAKPEAVKQAAGLGLPTIIEALTRNASSPEKKISLAKALEDHQDDDVSDLEGFLNKLNPEDSSKMLGHILGDKKGTVEQKISASSGLGAGQVSGLLSMLAPILMGMLGNKKKAENVGVDGLSDLSASLGGLLKGGSGGGLMDMATKILDSDGDGSIMDNLGDLFGGLFGKK